MSDALFTDVAKTATLSDCGTYRYRLGRRWGPGSTVLWIMLNPSTADAYEDDPTIRRCIGFAKTWGHDAIEVVNLFALRATNPRELREHPDPIGPENGETIYDAMEAAPVLIMAAWGAGGTGLHMAIPRMAQVVATCALAFDRRLHCIGVSKEGHPRHPLYMRGDAEPIPFGGAA